LGVIQQRLQLLGRRPHTKHSAGLSCHQRPLDRIHLDLDFRVIGPCAYSKASNSPIQTELFDPSFPVVFTATGTKTGSYYRADWIGFHEGHGGLNVWRQLQESGMRSVYFHNTMITRFFNAYQGTLTRIGLTYVLLDSGSWTDIVQTIHDLPFLETLSLYY
jgi:hypothetical protein